MSMASRGRFARGGLAASGFVLFAGLACGRVALDGGSDDVGAAGGADAGSVCSPPRCVCDGFVMPNAAGAGLPNGARYEAAAAGVVVDDVTGLAWEQTPTPNDTAYAQADAVAHCAAQTTGGHDDWRLPTEVELVSILDEASPDNPLPGTLMPGPVGSFWTSSPTAIPGMGLGVSFVASSATPITSDVHTKLSARCVRTGGTPRPLCYATRYALDSDVATDQATGLAWRRRALPGATSWSDALAACPPLGAGWRLPTVKELETIVAHAAPAPLIDTAVFPDGQPIQISEGTGQLEVSAFWTSSPLADNSQNAWTVDFRDGNWGSTPVSLLDRVRCVR
jgi:uncharacterized protein DUF1566